MLLMTGPRSPLPLASLLLAVLALALVPASAAAGRPKGSKNGHHAEKAERAGKAETPGKHGDPEIPALDTEGGGEKDADGERLWEPPLPEAPRTAPEKPASAPAAAPSKGSSPVKISGVLFDGKRPGEPDPEEAIRLTNTDLVHPAAIGDFSISDRYGPPRNAVAPPHSDTNAPRELWVAWDGQVFVEEFGFLPQFEGRDTLEQVPQIAQKPAWPTWSALHGVVSLHDAYGNLVDVVPYERSPMGDALDKADLPKGSWSGRSVMLFHASPFGWTGQILARDRDAKGRLEADTDSAEDWDSSFSSAQLGHDANHRVEFPGQTRLWFPHFEDPDAEIVCASAPENAFAALKETLDAAKKQILVHIYQFENDHIADLLLAAKQRGVDVQLYMEGSPVGGMPDQERYIAERLHAAKIPVWFLISDEAKHIRNRYRFDHSKYVIVDGERVMIATENFGYTGHPVDPTFGNRGWMVHIRSKELARQLRSVWDQDLDPRHHRDLVEIAQDPSDNWGFPYKHPPFQLRRAVVTGSYPLRRPPFRAQEKLGLELVACPDTCLAEDGAVLGLIGSAKETLFVLQNSMPLWWGTKGEGSPETTPNLMLQATVAAARRGVRVRMLLDGTWYNQEPNDPRDNDDTVRYLNELAVKEHLNLEAKVINLVSTSLEKIHAKGVIADGRRTFIGSINGTENSFKANREIGVVVDHPGVATYYATLFQRDWAMTRLYQAEVGGAGAQVRTTPSEAASVLATAKAGQLLDVMAEQAGFLEVRLSEKATGYLATGAVEEVVAVPEETPALLGRAAKVRGRVRGTHVSKAGVSLNFGVNWRTDFSVFIPTSAVGAFQAAGLSLPAAFEGRLVEVRGTLFEKDGPSIRVEAPGLLKLLP
jgi:cardiolipin synthase